MSKSHMGAKVMYCGHDGWFVADIFLVAGANVIKASRAITGGNLVRGANSEATHHVVDFPVAGCWSPEKGVLVVPSRQVRDLRTTRRSK